MNKPLLSVVMVVCDVERFLGESIESILNQTFRNFEFIIIDYGSTDSSKNIIGQYAKKDPRVRLYEIPHCGLAEARNAGCLRSQAEYIAIMDADDIALPTRLQLEMDFMKMHPTVGLLGGAVQWINARGRAVYVGRFPRDDKKLRQSLAFHCPFWQPTVLLRKESFVRVAGYRNAFAPAEDYDLWLRVAEHFQCANLDDIVLKYRIHPQQVSMRRRNQQTLGILAAQTSAALRQAGQPDVFDSLEVITPEVLTELGVTASMQERMFVSESRRWIRQMSLAGENSVALDTAVQLLQSCSTQVEKWQVADLHLTIAGLRWKKREFSHSIRSALQAVRVRPKVLGRPLRPLLQRIGLVHTN